MQAAIIGGLSWPNDSIEGVIARCLEEPRFRFVPRAAIPVIDQAC